MINKAEELIYEEFPFLKKLDKNDLMILAMHFWISMAKKSMKSTEVTIIDEIEFLIQIEKD
jgi:hypothetical protein